MIDKKEIRIGNWFNHNLEWSYNGNTGYFQWEDRDWYALGESTLFLENITPIPLTEEWLLKFDLVETHDSIKKFDVPAYNNRSHTVFLEYHLKGWYMTTPHIIKEVQWVHQFQNLYYAVYLQELEVK